MSATIHLDTVGDNRLRALLVDRDGDTRGMYAAYLLGFSVWATDQAGDGREALLKAGSRRYDAIVTETRLPFVSGYDLCAQLKRDRLTAAIPIIMVTGDAFVADIERARRVGADAVLLKPCLPDELTHELNRQFALSRHDDTRWTSTPGEQVGALATDIHRMARQPHPTILDDLGLVRMEERLRIVGGTLVLRAQPGGGAHVDARVPFLQ